jgi:hypothetical protein
MSGIRVSIDLNASTARVWEVVEPIERHIDWMADAVAIRFKTEQTRGTGTAFFCDTKVGPINLADEMTITSWEPEKEMGVTHTGVVTGTGVFTLTALSPTTTRFTWTEVLVFPWWLGGKLGALVGGQVVMKAIWRRNLRKLKKLVEQ